MELHGIWQPGLGESQLNVPGHFHSVPGTEYYGMARSVVHWKPDGCFQALQMNQTPLEFTTHIPLFPLVPPTHPPTPAQVRGLCGTFNWDQQDEFTTPEGDIESSAVAFANKFQASPECASLGAFTFDPCSTYTQRRQFAETACAVLDSPSFQVREEGRSENVAQASWWRQGPSS